MRSLASALGVLLLTVTPALTQETMAGYLVEEYSCIMCHTEMRTDFLEGVHSRRGILCTDCHGGDPGDFEIAGAHSGGFGGRLDKSEAVALCLTCHGNIPQMRQYALEPVTRETYLVSRHGQALLIGGDTLAPSCGDCHGSHAIYPRSDPRSPVSPTGIGGTCAACHSDPSRMHPGMPTDQYSEWMESAHGRALQQRHNEQSATCASCHGSHSALPPGVQEIPNVCGKCHQLVRDAYFRGPHGRFEDRGGEGGVPCTGCHENHRTNMPPLGEIASLCLGCHAADSPEGTAGLQLQEEVQAAQSSGERARAAIRYLEATGERIDDEAVNLYEVETHLQELLVKAHSLDPMAVDELERHLSDLATGMGERADVVGEHRWERKLLAIPVWILLLGGILLALRKRRTLAPDQAGGDQASGGPGQ